MTGVFGSRRSRSRSSLGRRRRRRRVACSALRRSTAHSAPNPNFQHRSSNHQPTFSDLCVPFPPPNPRRLATNTAASCKGLVVSVSYRNLVLGNDFDSCCDCTPHRTDESHRHLVRGVRHFEGVTENAVTIHVESVRDFE